MSRPLAGTAAVVVVAIALLGGTGGALGQDTFSAPLDTSGMIQVGRGNDGLAMIELSAHGPNWQHAPQEGAIAEVTDLPDGDGKLFTGTLPVPGTDGGAIEYTEALKLLPQGLHLEYDLTMTTAMKLNGIQLSVYLPVAQYAGTEVTVGRLGGDPELVGLPDEQARNFQVWRGNGAKVEVAKGTDDAITVEMRAATDVVIQDLRQWEKPMFEIRFPAIMQQEGRDVAAGDKFHLDLAITFTAPVELEGP